MTRFFFQFIASSFFSISVLASVKSYYTREVQPLFDGRCVACHSCYNSPCQLKLSSYEGLQRGLHQTTRVYDSKRRQSIAPTRLFIDGHTEADWREHKFISVLEPKGSQGPLLQQVIIEKDKEAEAWFPPKLKKSEESRTCYAKEKKVIGMPFGLTALNREEKSVLTTWLLMGSPGPSQEELESLKQPSTEGLKEVRKWENYLNRTGLKEQLISRYIYEHLYLAKIYFTENDEYFRLIRSKTACRKGVELTYHQVDTRRPYEDPQGAVYYCLRKSMTTPIHKTHIVYRFDDARMDRYKELFESDRYGQWQVSKMPSYEISQSANPFVTFESIPAKARYQFLLDEAQYFVMTFIRGPVCKGPTAVNVINDHFYVMFLDPEAYSDQTMHEFVSQNKKLLDMPATRGSDFGPVSDYEVGDLEKGKHEILKFLFGVESFVEVGDMMKAGQVPPSGVLRKRIEFRKNKAEFYRQYHPNGYKAEHIWDGDQKNKNALLTVMRHHDSATVMKGPIGPDTQTLWVLDYTLLEGIYYNLVAGFDVFGDISHQLSTRYYMSQQRLDGEEHFLSFVDKNYRSDLRASWYRPGGGVQEKKMPLGRRMESWYPMRHIMHGAGLLTAKGEETKEQLLSRTFESIYDQRFAELYGQSLSSLQHKGENSFQAMTSTTANQHAQYFPDLSLIRVRKNNGADEVFSIVHNKAHYNVAFIFAEGSRRAKGEDRLFVVPNFVGSYPMQFFDISEAQKSEFAREAAAVRSKKQYANFVKKYGVDKQAPNFWSTYDFMLSKFREVAPIEAGILDLNRYGNIYE